MSPTFSLLDKCLLKCVAEQAEDIIMIVPVWKGRSFLDMFSQLAITVQTIEPGTHFFELVQNKKEAICAGPLRWPVMAGYLSFKFYFASLRARQGPLQF